MLSVLQGGVHLLPYRQLIRTDYVVLYYRVALLNPLPELVPQVPFLPYPPWRPSLWLMTGLTRLRVAVRVATVFRLLLVWLRDATLLPVLWLVLIELLRRTHTLAVYGYLHGKHRLLLPLFLLLDAVLKRTLSLLLQERPVDVGKHAGGLEVKARLPYPPLLLVLLVVARTLVLP